MALRRTAGVLVVCLLAGGRTGVAVAQTAAVPDGPPAPDADASSLFRVFLQDGTSLASYGELARLDDRVVFSMPTSASAAAPQLQLINIPSSTVDWERTLNYAETVRASRYLATRADTDYALLTGEIAQALSDVGQTGDTSRRLAIVEQARRTLADWPAQHYNYKRDEIDQMLGTLDEAIASLRASSGASAFDLTFVAPSAPTPRFDEPLLPAPTPRDAIEQTLHAAMLTQSPAERLSLLTVAASALSSEGATLPSDWASSTLAKVQADIRAELRTNARYQALSERMLALANARARAADVRGVQRVIASIHANDKLLGETRPDTVAAMVAAVEDELDAARRLRLERDRWALRAPALRAYRAAMASSIQRLKRLAPALEDIKALAGSGPDEIGAILSGTERIRTIMASLTPPTELAEIHNLFASAVQLAASAARIRREAALTESMPRAWDASSAAAGALMLSAKANADLQDALRAPQFR